MILSGDFNIDILSIKQRLIFKNYFETILSYGLYPTISFPTRIAENSATLIDQIFTNFENKSSQSSGVIISNISDHFPLFYCINNDINKYNKPNKYIYHKVITKKNIENLYLELEKIIYLHL